MKVYLCDYCHHWERRNGGPAPNCPNCRRVKDRVLDIGELRWQGRRVAGEPVIMRASTRLTPTPTEAWGTCWEDL